MSGRAALAFALSLALVGCPAPKEAEKPAEQTAVDPEQQTLYALGASIAQRSLPGLKLEESDLQSIQEGFADAALGRPLRADPRTAAKDIQELLTERRAAAAAAEKLAAAAFLEEAAKGEGAEKLASGLIYQPLKQGDGAQPAATDRVKVHYKGSLRDGTVFDSSYDRGQPAVFGLNRVVPCWTEGLQRMKPGGKARLTCPSDLGYGDRGVPGRIPPGAPLVFEVELVEVVQAPPPPSGAAARPPAPRATPPAAAKPPTEQAPAAKAPAQGGTPNQP